MEELVSKYTIFIVIKDIIVTFLSITAIAVSINTCSKQSDSNQIASDANILAKEVSESSLKFNVINAEAQWGILRDAYDEIDDKILVWEKSQNLKRDGKSFDSISLLERLLEKLKVPEEIRKLYLIRNEKYKILINVSNQYEPFRERLSYIAFRLPTAPKLPTGVITGGGTGSITGGGTGSMTAW